MPTVPNGIIFFWYHASPYGRRVKAYLTLRHIEHAECIQPPILPRPDISALGVHYRRSPIMTIGRDVYLDTRLMIAKLEELFPASHAHPGLSSVEAAGMASLLQKLSVEIMFRETVKQIPPEPMFKDPKFQKDRAGFFGPEQWQAQDPQLSRAEGITHMRHCFDILESLLVDGRKWIAGTEQISLADLEGIWIIDWLIGGLHPAPTLSEQHYPGVYSWRQRYREQLNAAKAKTKRAVVVKGTDAQSCINSSDFVDRLLVVDDGDPLQLREGSIVEVFPTDSGGFTHQDKGRLIKLTKDEVAIAVESAAKQEIHVHAPRWNFRIRALDASSRL